MNSCDQWLLTLVINLYLCPKKKKMKKKCYQTFKIAVHNVVCMFTILLLIF